MIKVDNNSRFNITLVFFTRTNNFFVSDSHFSALVNLLFGKTIMMIDELIDTVFSYLDIEILYFKT